MKKVEDIVKKWIANTAAAGDSIKAGVMAIPADESPLAKAAAREDHWAAQVAAAARANKFSKGLQSVSLESWKQSVIEKGIPAYIRGTQLARNKVERYMRALMPIIKGIKDNVLPARGTFEQNMERARRMAEELHGYYYDKATGQLQGRV